MGAFVKCIRTAILVLPESVSQLNHSITTLYLCTDWRNWLKERVIRRDRWTDKDCGDIHWWLSQTPPHLSLLLCKQTCSLSLSLCDLSAQKILTNKTTANIAGTMVKIYHVRCACYRLNDAIDISLEPPNIFDTLSTHHF